MMSIRRRLLLWLLAGLGLVWLLASVSVFVTVRNNLEGKFDAELREMASEVRYLMPGSRYLQEASPAAYWFDFFKPDSGLYFQVWDEYLLFSDISPSLGDLELPLPGSFSAEPRTWDVVLATGEATRAIAQQFTLRSGGSGEASTNSVINVVVARNRDALDQSLKRLLMVTVVAGLLIVPVTFLIARVAVGWGLMPLRALAEDVAARGIDSLHQKFRTEGIPGELVPISQRLNELMHRLEIGVDRERRLTADLAHELRTPVAELKTMAEVALAWPDRQKPNDAQEVLGIAEQMQAVIDNMLLLARWDRGIEHPNMESVDVSELVQKCWQTHVTRANEKELKVQWVMAAGVHIETNPELLQRVVTNLLSNAVAYCPEGGDVHINGTSHSGKLRLSVSNTVSGLKEEHLPHLFDRFWRGEVSRGGEGHAGLGLSVARSCADALGLELSATLDEPAGTIQFSLSSGIDPDAEQALVT